MEEFECGVAIKVDSEDDLILFSFDRNQMHSTVLPVERTDPSSTLVTNNS